MCVIKMYNIYWQLYIIRLYTNVLFRITIIFRGWHTEMVIFIETDV